jgi:hypothetical protein
MTADLQRSAPLSELLRAHQGSFGER